MLDLKNQLSDYFDHVVRHVEAEDVLLKHLGSDVVRPIQPRVTPSRRRWWAAAAAGFLLAVLVIGTVALLLRGSSDPRIDPVAPPVTPTTPATTSTALEATVPATAFSWDRDDLGEWVTEAEMTAALVSLGIQGNASPGGAAYERTDSDPADGFEDFIWRMGSWRVIVHTGDHGKDEDTTLTQTDPRLPEGVTYEAATGFAHGFYILSGPNSDESICIGLMPPGTSFGYPRSPQQLETHEERVFTLASMMLREMGWTD